MYACKALVDGFCTEWGQLAEPAVSDPSGWPSAIGMGFVVFFGFWLFGAGFGVIFSLVREAARA